MIFISGTSSVIRSIKFHNGIALSSDTLSSGNYFTDTISNSLAQNLSQQQRTSVIRAPYSSVQRSADTSAKKRTQTRAPVIWADDSATHETRNGMVACYSVATPIAVPEACRYPGIKLSAVTTRKESQRGPHEYLRMTRAHPILAKDDQRGPHE